MRATLLYRCIVYVTVCLCNVILVYGQNSTLWLDLLRENQLAVNEEQFETLKEDPLAFESQRAQMAECYNQIRAAIEEKRGVLAMNLAGNSDRETGLTEAEEILIQGIERVLIPLWVGNTWDFNGVPRDKPDLDHPIACGHFVQKIMKDAGFNLVRNGSTQMAYLSTKHWVQSLTGTDPVNYRNWSGTLAKFKAEGPGLYVMGVDVTSGWGHMLFARYYGEEEVLLLHAGIHPGCASMHLDEGKYYLDEFLDLQNVWLARFDSQLVETWLLGDAIKPAVRMD